MSDVYELLARQADSQKGRTALSWPEKIRMAERVRDSVLRLRRTPGKSYDSHEIEIQDSGQLIEVAQPRTGSESTKDLTR